MRDVDLFYVKCGEFGNNFGDELSATLVKQITHRGIHWMKVENVLDSELVAIGSVLHLVPNIFQNHIWGTGIIEDSYTVEYPHAKIHALRGELTAKRLGIKRDIPFGDPGILWKGEWKPKYRLGILPHYVDAQSKEIAEFTKREEDVLVIDPLARDACDRIATCQMIISSSLHGLIIADSLGIPNRWTLFSDNKIVGHGFKFRDYYSAYMMYDPIPYRFDKVHSIENIERWIREEWAEKPVERVRKELLDAFPKELIDG